MNGRILSYAATGFCCAAVSARWWPSLPQSEWLLILAGAAVMAVIPFSGTYCNAKRKQKPLRLCCAVAGGAICGIIMAASLGQSYLNWQQLGGEIQQDVIIEGRIVSYHQQDEYHRFILTVLNVDDQRWQKQYCIQLNYYRPLRVFRVGQTIRAHVRIKPARSVANPYGVDMQQWFVSERIVKTGYVRGQKIWLTTPDTGIRSLLIARLQAYDLPAQKWLMALLFGERQGFTSSDWALLQQTGTAHLFAISGLHLMIVAGVILIALRAVALAAALCKLPVPANYLSLSIGVSLWCCGFYAYLADWQTAVLRAFTLVVIVTGLYFLKMRHSRLTMLLLSMAGCIIVDPFSVYGASLYLSVGAVAIIIWFHWWWTNRTDKLPVWQGMVMLQLALSLLMAPLVGALLGQVSLISPVVNIMVVPLMSMLVIPLCLAGLLCLLILPAGNWLTAYIFNSCSTLLTWLMDGLSVVGVWEDSITVQTGAVLPWLGGLVLMGLVFLVPPFKGRAYLLAAGGLAWAGVYFNPWSAGDHWQLHVFDVGQGSAALISRGDEAVLIDTGAGFVSGFNFAEAVIMPFITARRLSLVQVIISHSDNDHAGGARALNKAFPVAGMLTTENRCHSGFSQYWQGLHFTVLWPPASLLGELTDNNASCVVMVSDANHRVMIAGDIEAAAEQALIAQTTDLTQLQSTLLIAPHHGSKTSSSMEFVTATAPEYVVFTQGWLNRWGFPHESVLARYRALNSKTFLTSKTGYLRFDFNGPQLSHFAYRSSSDSRWFHKVFVNE